MSFGPEEEGVLLARNALFRAWKAHGVPLRIEGQGLHRGLVGTSGRWVLMPSGAAAVWLECTGACSGTGLSLRPPISGVRCEEVEALVLGALSRHYNCTHLAALATKPPLEVMAIAELEFIAGEEG